MTSLLFLIVAAFVDRPSTAVAATTEAESDQRRLRRPRGAAIGKDASAAANAEANFVRLLATEERNANVGGGGTDDEDWAFWARELNGSHSGRRRRDLLEERSHMASEERGGRRRLEQQAAADFGGLAAENGALSTENEDAAFWTRALEGGSMS